MKRVFYGGAIQGAEDRSRRAHVHRFLIEAIKDRGFEVISEHTRGRDTQETASLMEESIGPLPGPGMDRTARVRQKMIEAVEGEICCAVFEVSVPSLGTGIELAHAYSRPRMGLGSIPIMALYESGYWPGGLSAMVRGITDPYVSHFRLIVYNSLEEAEAGLESFLDGL